MLSVICVCQVKGEQPAGDGAGTTEPYFDSATVECAIQLCPQQLKNGEMLMPLVFCVAMLCPCHTFVSGSCGEQICSAFSLRLQPLE